LGSLGSQLVSDNGGLKLTKNLKGNVKAQLWIVFTQVIFTYLYGGSILFFLYVFCYLLHDTSQRKRQRNKDLKEKETKKDEECAEDAAGSKSGERKQSFLQVCYMYIMYSLSGETLFFMIHCFPKREENE